MIQEPKKKEQELKKFQKLLAGPEKEFLDFGKAMAPESQIIKRENELGELIEKEAIAKVYQTKVITNLELKEDIKKYCLSLTKMERYKGDFHTSYLKDVKEFLAKKEIKVSDYDLKSCMFALYPGATVWYPCDMKEYDVYRGDRENNPTLLWREGNFYHVIHTGTNYKTLNNWFRGLIYGEFHILFRILAILLIAVLPVWSINHFGFKFPYKIIIEGIWISWNVARFIIPSLQDSSGEWREYFITRKLKNITWY